VSEVIIVGAGPYGLSIAAHLRACGVGFRIFGRPMGNWRTRMPRGMHLKSDGFASNLYDPGWSFTLKNFCQQQNIAYADEGVPVAVDKFIAYGEAFQRRFAPGVEERAVVALDRAPDGFAATLDDGEIVVGRKVIVAIGISDFPYLPPVFDGIAPNFLSHASQHADLEQFRGREVAVVGSGSSAIDLAALLHEGGAGVRLIARRPQLRFHDRTERGDRRWFDDNRRPVTGIGPGWRNVFYTTTPQLFRHLPDDKRRRIITQAHGPAGGWFMRDRIIGKVPVVEGLTPQRAAVKDGRIQLRLAGSDGHEETVSADHVIAATGYKVDLRAIGFLGRELRDRINTLDQAPVLSRHFETSVPGLYVVGPAASWSFGPLFRFVHGVGFAAPRVARHLAATAERRPIVAGAALPARQ